MDSNSVPELRKKVFPVSAAVIELVEVTFSTRVSVSAAAFNSATVAVKLVVPSFNVP